jgi:hypothetical protein
MANNLTAVECLYERLERMIPRTALYNIEKIEYFQQAKELEKQQQGYSEEEVEAILKQAYGMGRGNYTIKAFNEWLEIFKNK